MFFSSYIFAEKNEVEKTDTIKYFWGVDYYSVIVKTKDIHSALLNVIKHNPFEHNGEDYELYLIIKKGKNNDEFYAEPKFQEIKKLLIN